MGRLIRKVFHPRVKIKIATVLKKSRVSVGAGVEMTDTALAGGRIVEDGLARNATGAFQLKRQLQNPCAGRGTVETLPGHPTPCRWAGENPRPLFGLMFFVKCWITAPVAKDRSVASPGAPSPLQPVCGPAGLFTELLRPVLWGTPRNVNCVQVVKAVQVFRDQPNSLSSLGFSKFFFQCRSKLRCEERVVVRTSVAMNVGSIVKLFSARWHVPHVRPFPLKGFVEKRIHVQVPLPYPEVVVLVSEADIRSIKQNNQTESDCFRHVLFLRHLLEKESLTRPI